MTLPQSMKPLLDTLAGYPDWALLGLGTIVAALVLWLLAKLLKWGLTLLIWLVLIAGAVLTVLLFLGF